MYISNVGVLLRLNKVHAGCLSFGSLQGDLVNGKRERERKGYMRPLFNLFGVADFRAVRI